MLVDPVFEVVGQKTLTITKATRAADLVIPLNVNMLDGRPANWNVATNVGWLRPRATTGRAGIDPIYLDIDPRYVDVSCFGSREYESVDTTLASVSIDRPGVLSQAAVVYVTPDLSSIHDATPARLIAGRPNTLRVLGRYRADILQSGDLRVTGARVASQMLVQDMAFLGDVRYFVEMNVDGLVAGQSIVVQLDQGLASKTLSVPIVEPTPLPAPDLGLPVTARKPPSIVVEQPAVYWAEPGQVRAARWNGASWTLHGVAVPGLIDVDLDAHEGVLIAVTPAAIVELDAQTLAERRRALTFDYSGVDPHTLFAGAPTDRAVAITFEGAPWVIQRAVNDTSGYALLARTVPNGPSMQRPFGSHLPLVAGLGLLPETNPHGFVRSSDRTAVLGFGRVDGKLPMRGFQHRDPVGTFTFELFDPLPSQTPVALSSGGTRMIDRAGVVFERMTGARAGLAGLAPSGMTMRGFSLSNDGQFAYAYASTLNESEPGLYIESQPLLLVFALQGPGGALFPTLVRQITFTQPVNCRTAPAPQNECSATPYVVVDEFGFNAVVVGREGMSVASLP